MRTGANSAGLQRREDRSSSLHNFTKTFILSQARNTEVVMPEIPETLGFDPSRQRRAHRKSKTACENCRRRRVKCNERIPCVNCLRRGEECRQRLLCKAQLPKPVDKTPLVSTQITRHLDPTHYSISGYPHKQKLFHHFRKHTRYTLFLPAETWDSALRLCSISDFLSNAVLCVAARHLSTLKPKDTTYSTTAASLLGQALSRLRYQVSANFTTTNLDAFIATTLLLHYEIWTCTDLLIPPGGSDLTTSDPLRDSIFAFSSGLKKVFSRSVPLIEEQPSIFRKHIASSSLDILVEAAQISENALVCFQEFFSYHRPFNSNMLDIPLPYKRTKDLLTPNPWNVHPPKHQDAIDLIKHGYEPAVSRLCLILSFLPKAHPPVSVNDNRSLLTSLAGYIFNFPVMCHGPFVEMVQRGDPHALVLLYHFYRAVRILLPADEYWWAHRRAVMSENILREWIGTWTPQRQTSSQYW